MGELRTMLRPAAISLCVLSLLAAVAGSLWLVMVYDRLGRAELVRVEVGVLIAACVALLLAPCLPRAGATWADRVRVALPVGAAVLCVAAVVFYVDVRARTPVRVPDAYADWLQYRSRRFLFVYPATSAVGADIAARAQAADRRFDAVAAFFGASFDQRLTAYIHQDAERGAELLGRSLPCGDAERWEIHLLASSSVTRWAALVAAEKAWGGPSGTTLLREGVPTYLDGRQSHWPAALSYLKGELPMLEVLVHRADRAGQGRIFAASFVRLLLDVGPREALAKLWPSRTFRGSVYQTYGQRADELEEEWHGHLAGLLGFGSASEFEATASTEVALNSEQAAPARQLTEGLREALVGDRPDRARAVLAAEASPAAEEVVRTLIEKQVNDVELIGLNDYGGKCLLADLHISTTVDGRAFEMDVDGVLSASAPAQVLHLALR